MSDAALGFLLYPGAVVAHVVCQSVRSGPLAEGRCMDCWIDGWPASKSWWNFDQRFSDKHCHRIEIAGRGFKAEALRLERYRSASAERVKNVWGVVVTG